MGGKPAQENAHLIQQGALLDGVALMAPLTHWPDAPQPVRRARRPLPRAAEAVSIWPRCAAVLMIAIRCRLDETPEHVRIKPTRTPVRDVLREHPIECWR